MRKKSTNAHETNSLPRIGIDLLGSDASPQQLFKALLSHLTEFKNSATFTVFTTQEVLDKIDVPSEIQCVVVSEIITMEDDPLLAIRRKKNASLCQGIRLLSSYDLDAFITAGNTGALIASSSLYLPMLPGIERPALMTLIPTKQKPLAVLDVGANVNVTAEHLVQFAQMGIAYQKTRDVAHPTVGLLNIGTEKIKGTPELRKAYEHLQKLNRDRPIDSPIFMGNIEGRDVFHGDIDVVVTDGFTGNVFLKTAEGIAAFILDELQKFTEANDSSDFKQVLAQLGHRLHYAEYPGAILCGVDGIVLKFHGNSSPLALYNSVKGAIRLVNHFFLEKIKQELKK